MAHFLVCMFVLFIEVIFKAMSESVFDRLKKKAKEKKLLEVGDSKLKKKKKNKFGSQKPFTLSHLLCERQQKRKNGPWNNKNKIEV